MKKILLAAASALLAFSAYAGKVNLTSVSFVYTDTTEWNDQISILFERCMANNLYTFSEVKLNGTLVNKTTSDNIGPFLIDNSVWLGGNHTNGYPAVNSAKTKSVTVELDGEVKKRGTYNNVKIVHVNVVNELYYYPSMEKFADEIFDYYISGNSIEVFCHHDFIYPKPSVVTKYYGAQSMYPATEILLPGALAEAKYRDGSTGPTEFKNEWIDHVSLNICDIDVYKKDDPTFSTFIEHNDNGYQVVYKYPEGLGSGDCIPEDGPIYLFRKYGTANTGKSYHVMMWEHPIDEGLKTDWHALYSWFGKPIEDTFRNPVNAASDAESDDKPAEKIFSYNAYINGQITEMKINSDGVMNPTTSGIEDVITDNTVAGVPVEYYNLQGVKVSNPSAGIYIARDAAGNSSKIMLK